MFGGNCFPCAWSSWGVFICNLLLKGEQLGHPKMAASISEVKSANNFSLKVYDL
jgi:hypothetical protein